MRHGIKIKINLEKINLKIKIKNKNTLTNKIIMTTMRQWKLWRTQIPPKNETTRNQNLAGPEIKKSRPET